MDKCWLVHVSTAASDRIALASLFEGAPDRLQAAGPLTFPPAREKVPMPPCPCHHFLLVDLTVAFLAGVTW